MLEIQSIAGSFSKLNLNEPSITKCEHCSKSIAAITKDKCSNCFADYCNQHCKTKDFEQHAEKCRPNLHNLSLRYFKTELDQLFNESHLVDLLFRFYDPTIEVQLAIDALKKARYITSIFTNLNAVFNNLNEELQNNYAVALFAVSQKDFFIECLPKPINSNMDIIIAAVQKNGNRYNDLAREFQEDREIARAAVNQNWEIYQKLARALQEDKEIARAFVSQEYERYTLLPKILKDEEEFACGYVSKYPWLIRNLTEKMQKNKNVALTVVRKDSSCYQTLDESLKKDKDIARAAGRRIE